MLTAKGEESDIVIGLELGAVDYVVKPFSMRVLASRIRAVLRRNQLAPSETGSKQIEGLEIVPDRFEAKISGYNIGLTATEFRILQLLSGHPGRVFTREQIVNSVRGEDYPVTDRSVDVHMTSLRKKLGEYGSHIETVRGVGYRMKD
jgi:two-component system phosphate regulon response regulator PhoB